MRIIEINDEYITLGQFLKLTDCISTGGEAKFFLQQHDITVNGVSEKRRGKKLYDQYIVDIAQVGRFEVRQKK